MGVLGCDFVGRHGKEAVLLLVRVYQFDDALLDEVSPSELACGDLGDHLLGEKRPSVVRYDERPHDPAGAEADVEPSVASLVELRVVQDARARVDLSLSPELPEGSRQTVSVVYVPDEPPIHEYLTALLR